MVFTGWRKSGRVDLEAVEMPEILGARVPVVHLEMDGSGVPMVKAETEGRVGKIEG